MRCPIINSCHSSNHAFIQSLYHHPIIYHPIIVSPHFPSYYYPIVYHITILSSHHHIHHPSSIDHHTIILSNCDVIPSHHHPLLQYAYLSYHHGLIVSHHNAIIQSYNRTIISLFIIHHTIIHHAMLSLSNIIIYYPMF